MADDNRSSTSEIDGVSETTTQHNDPQSVEIDSAVNSATPPEDALRDAGAGKVRGPHGRYVNKTKTASPTTRKGPRIKHVVKCKLFQVYGWRNRKRVY